MDWPVDPDGEEGSEGGRKYGHAVLVKLVDEDEFPVERDEFVDEYSDHPVRVDHERVVSVADIFDPIEREEFGDIVAFHRAVGHAMRQQGYWPRDAAETE